MTGVTRRRFFRGYHIAYAALAGVLACEIIAAAIVGHIAFDLSPLSLFELGNYLRTLPGWFILPLIWIGLVTYQLVKRRIDRPTRTLFRLTRYRSDWLLRGLLLLAAYPVMAKSFGVLKSAIPMMNEFYLDPFLMKLDIWMLGDHAWRLSHGLMPSWFLVAIDRVYVLWITYVILCTGIFSFTRDPRFQIRGALAFHLAWIVLGICLATGLASVGPVFYDATYGGNHFGPLLAELGEVHENQGLVAVYAMDFLVKNMNSAKLFGGISAMPSMHVTMAYFGFLLAMHYEGMRWLKVLTAGFTIATLLGSVHLGWHYLSDGLVGIVLMTGIWFGAGRFVDWSYRGLARFE